MRIKFLLSLFLLFSISLIAELQPEKKNSSAFAIVVDNKTYTKIGKAVDAYRDAVEKDGLSTYLLVNEWTNPSEIRNELEKLYNKSPKLEGAVFIGDVPIPMIRNAQHLTSAFKLAEDRYPYIRSSVPSDRYYEDFDLKFRYLYQDSTNNLLYYFSLLPESPQKINKEIYSARIKAPVNDESRYGIIEKYLHRVVRQKSEKNAIDKMFVFTGHGYYSESIASWADERLSLSEQFPQLYKAGNRIKNLNHEMSDDMKEIIFREIEEPQLDIAIFHAHGNPDMQYLLDYPNDGSVNASIESVKLYLRSKLRSSNNPEATKAGFIKQYDVPETWFEGAFVDSVIKADSLLGYSLDIYSSDIDSISPQSEFVMFDECFNGSFHQQNYIAGKYVFGNGTVVTAEANTVNVLQDKWADEYLGLLNKGVRIGLWHRYKNLLESHLIGDPTYYFHYSSEDDFNQVILSDNNSSLMKKYITDPDPLLRLMGVDYLLKISGSENGEELVNIYKTDPSLNVRMHALKCLAELNGELFQEVLKLSINDPYELIRRFSAVWMGEVGKDEYLPYMFETLLNDESTRVLFNVKNSLAFFNNKLTSESANEFFANKPQSKLNKDFYNSINYSVKRNYSWLYEEIIPNILNDTLSLKSRLQEVRTFRNYHFHEAIPQLLNIAGNDKQDLKVRTAILESLGWFNQYYNKAIIITSCEEIMNNDLTPPEVKEEALRTRNRLTTGLNNVFIP